MPDKNVVLQEGDVHVFEVPERSATVQECNRYHTYTERYLSVQSSYIRARHQIETQVKCCRHWTMYLGSMKLRTLLDLLEWPRMWISEKSNAQTLMCMNEGRHCCPCAL